MKISQVSYVSHPRKFPRFLTSAKNFPDFPQKIYIVRNLYGRQKQKPPVIEASGPKEGEKGSIQLPTNNLYAKCSL